MPKTELNVFFKMQQKDDKKEILKFEVKGNDQEQATNPLYPLAGSIIFFEIEGCKAGEVPAEFMNISRDSKKTALKFAIKGDSQEKAQELYKYAGNNVKLSVQASQMSLEDFYNEGDDDDDREESNHEGVEYSIDLGGSVQVNESDTDKEETAAAEDDDQDPFGDDLD